MSENVKKKNKAWEYWPIVLIFIFTAFAIAYRFRQDQADLMRAKSHIITVVSAGRNCNDCHLGASFVNLFNHEAVKGNDNIVTLMMDNSKIKRW